MKTVKFSILSKDNKNILFVEMNREIEKGKSGQPKGANINGKRKSLKEYGILSPLLLLPAKFAKEEDLKMEDVNGKEVTDDSIIENSYIILDGNHRYKTYLRIKKEKENADKKGKSYDDEGKALNDFNCNIMEEEDKGDKKVLDMLIEINATAVNWKTNDYTRTAALRNPDDEALKYIYELQRDKKMPISVISLYLYGKGILNEKKMSEIAKGEGLPTGIELERGKKIISTLEDVKISETIIRKRYLIEEILATGDINKSLEAIQKLTLEEIEELENKLGKDEDAFEVVKDKMGE